MKKQGTARQKRKKKNLVVGPKERPDTKTDWPTGCRSQNNFDFEESEI
jgi:hypothetical protein